MRKFTFIIALLPLFVIAQQNPPGYESGIKSLLTNYRPGKYSVPKALGTQISRSSDTTVVGSNDTLLVTGAWQNSGPIFVLDSGVLVFDSAQATIMGDVIVEGNGQLWAVNSNLNIPQQYFYQRAVITAQYGFINVYNSTFSFSGMSHSFVFTDSSTVILRKVNFTDWTTTGTYNQPTFIIDSTNLVGEIVATDSSHIAISNSDTILLWHQIPRYAQLTWSFPHSDTVQAYSFIPTSTGVSGINYQINVSQCNTVWWAIMPLDSSYVSIGNSNLRAIGAWFTGTDYCVVTEVTDDVTYFDVNNLFTDRYLQLTNTSVITWSLYPMDSSVVEISGCIAGEIGSEDYARTICYQTFVDGSGGYFWASGNAVQYGIACAFSCNVRSEGNGIVLAQNSSISDGIASGIDASILLLNQTTVTSPPVANDGSDVWVTGISPPSALYVNDTIALPGSAYILRGPSSVLMRFASYYLQYQADSDAAWYPVTGSITGPVNQDTLGTWNTTGLTAGNYTVKLTMYDNWGDSITDTTSILLLPNVANGIKAITAPQIQLYPNPATDEVTIRLPAGIFNSLTITDLTGRIIEQQPVAGSTDNIELFVASLPPGVYLLTFSGAGERIDKKLVKE